VTDDLPPLGRLLDLAGRVAMATDVSGGVGAGIADGSPHVTGMARRGSTILSDEGVVA
jgi:hypothetical protein